LFPCRFPSFSSVLTLVMDIVILGAGIAGLTTALALRKHLTDPIAAITIYEIRPGPSTIGGAVNLTPKALRYLDYLGIDTKQLGVPCKTIQLYDLYTGQQYAELDFRGDDGNGVGAVGKKHHAARVLRADLQGTLLKAAEEQPGITIIWDKKVEKIEDRPGDNTVQLKFSDSEEVKCTLLVGCDGIHSTVRMLLIEPERQPEYTGIAVVMATTVLKPETTLRWQTTGLASSRKGSFMASYFEKSKTQQYISAVIEMGETADRQGWKVRGSDQKALKADILSRFNSKAMPELGNLIEGANEWSLYPVHRLPAGGKWRSPEGRCFLLGDAAHAMPPQGESTGICIEDAVLFSRAMMKHESGNLMSVLDAFEKFRRPTIDAAYSSAVQRWETVKDSGALAYKFKVFLTPWFLWWTARARNEEFAADYSEYDFVL
jgi:salicylate hydroxylase